LNKEIVIVLHYCKLLICIPNQISTLNRNANSESASSAYRKIKQALYSCWPLNIDIWISTYEIRSNPWLDQPDETAAGGRCRSSFASHNRHICQYYICFGKNGPLSFHQDTWLLPLSFLIVSVVNHRKINFPYLSIFFVPYPAASYKQDLRRYTFIAKITASAHKTLANLKRR